MATTKPPLIELTAGINSANRLVLTFHDLGNTLASMLPGTGLEDLFKAHGEATSLDIEVNDFYQFGTLYEIHAATLADDGRTVAAYWESTRRGRRHRFTRSASDKSGTVRFLVGATPRLPGAPAPAPFRSWVDDGGGLPTDASKEKGG